MLWEILAGVTTIISTIIALLTYLHLIERSRPRPSLGSQAASQGLSWPSVIACVALIGIFTAVLRQIVSSYIITVAGFSQRMPILTAFGIKFFGGGFIVKELTVFIFGLSAVFAAEAFAKRYGEVSEDLPGVAFIACFVSMLLATVVISEPLHNWWTANIAPIPE